MAAFSEFIVSCVTYGLSIIASNTSRQRSVEKRNDGEREREKETHTAREIQGDEQTQRSMPLPRTFSAPTIF